MPPPRISRLLLGLFLIALVVSFVDELVLWTGMPTAMRVPATGLATSAIVFAVLNRGGLALRFAMRQRPGPLAARRAFFRAVKRCRRRSGTGWGYAALRGWEAWRRFMRVDPVPAGAAPKVAAALSVVCPAGIPVPQYVVFAGRRPSAVTAQDGPVCCIFVSTALVRLLSQDGLEAVLAHECGHILAHHSKRLAFLLGFLAGFKLSVGVPPAAAIAVFLAYLMMLREWEYIADRQASGLVSHEAMIRAFEEYRKKSGDKDAPAWLEIFQCHPTIQHRIEALREYGTH